MSKPFLENLPPSPSASAPDGGECMNALRDAVSWFQAHANWIGHVPQWLPRAQAALSTRPPAIIEGQAEQKHHEAARMFLCWPTNFLDLCQQDTDLPKAVDQLAGFIARWEQIGLAAAPPAQVPEMSGGMLRLRTRTDQAGFTDSPPEPAAPPAQGSGLEHARKEAEARKTIRTDPERFHDSEYVHWLENAHATAHWYASELEQRIKSPPAQDSAGWRGGVADAMRAVAGLEIKYENEEYETGAEVAITMALKAITALAPPVEAQESERMREQDIVELLLADSDELSSETIRHIAKITHKAMGGIDK